MSPSFDGVDFNSFFYSFQVLLLNVVVCCCFTFLLPVHVSVSFDTFPFVVLQVIIICCVLTFDRLTHVFKLCFPIVRTIENTFVKKKMRMVGFPYILANILYIFYGCLLHYMCCCCCYFLFLVLFLSYCCGRK